MEALVQMFKALGIWTMRRTAILFFSLMYTFSVPKQMWASVADHRDGVGYFADPIAKPSLFTYWWSLSEMSYSTLFLRSKRPTEEGFAAASNSPSPAWGADGITVINEGRITEFKPPEGAAAVAGAENRSRIGVIVLPGALVSPMAYAPLARTIAQHGYPSFILKFDFNLAKHGWKQIGDSTTPPGLAG